MGNLHPALRKTKTLLVFLVLLLLFFVGQLFWIFSALPKLGIRTITVESDVFVPDEYLHRLLALDGQTWMSVDERKLEKKLEVDPMIDKARVIKVFPRTLRLFLSRRQPLVVILVNSENSVHPVFFDEEGYAQGLETNNVNLPILSGLQISLPKLGSRLPIFLRPILRDLSGIQSGLPHFFKELSEIEIMPRVAGGHDLRLYMNHIPVPVLVGSSLDEGIIRRAFLVLDVLERDGLKAVGQADIRGGQVAFQEVVEEG